MNTRTKEKRKGKIEKKAYTYLAIKYQIHCKRERM